MAAAATIEQFTKTSFERLFVSLLFMVRTKLSYGGDKGKQELSRGARRWSALSGRWICTWDGLLADISPAGMTSTLIASMVSHGSSLPVVVTCSVKIVKPSYP